MSTFKPRKVEKGAYKRWVSGGLELLSRRPITNIGLSLLLILPYFLINRNSTGIPYIIYVVYFIVSAPFIVSLFTWSAMATNSVASLRHIVLTVDWKRAAMRVGICYTLILGAMMAMTLFFVALSILFPGSRETAELSQVNLQVVSLSFIPAEALFGSVSIFYFLGVTWFLGPFFCIDEISCKKAVELSMEALEKNLSVFILPIVLVMGMSFTVSIIGILGLIGAPLLASIAYVSYLDVFWNKGIKKPARVHAPRSRLLLTT